MKQLLSPLCRQPSMLYCWHAGARPRIDEVLEDLASLQDDLLVGGGGSEEDVGGSLLSC